jgi:hypothetical protein
MNLQNKVAGRAFLTVNIEQGLVDEKPEYFVSDAGMLWRLNADTLDEYNLGDEVLEDIVAQLKEVGTLEDLRSQMGLQAWTGPVRGPVLRHSERPEINCMVTVMSGPNTGYNPNNYNYPADIMLDFFIDVDNLMGTGPSEVDAAINFFGAMGNSKIDTPIGEGRIISENYDIKATNYKEEASSVYSKLLKEGSEQAEDAAEALMREADNLEKRGFDEIVVEALYMLAAGVANGDFDVDELFDEAKEVTKRG